MRLADKAEALVGAAGRYIGVVADHRDAGGESSGRRCIECRRVDEANRDTVRLSGDSSLHRVDHLGDDAVLRTSPLVTAPQENAGILDTVDRGRKL